MDSCVRPAVEYSLTDLGRKFEPVLDAMKIWGLEYIDQMNRQKNDQAPIE